MEEWDELWRDKQNEDRERLEFLNKKNHSNKKIINYVDPKKQDIWGALKKRLETGNIDRKINGEYIKTVKKIEKESFTPQQKRYSMDKLLESCY